MMPPLGLQFYLQYCVTFNSQSTFGLCMRVFVTQQAFTVTTARQIWLKLVV